MNEEMKKLLDSLSDEQKEKAKACKTREEFLKFAADAGIALSDELLEGVAGGKCDLDIGLDLSLI